MHTSCREGHFTIGQNTPWDEFGVGCNGKPVYRNSPVFFKYRNNRCLKREIPNIPKFSVKEKYRKIPKNTDYIILKIPTIIPNTSPVSVYFNYLEILAVTVDVFLLPKYQNIQNK